MRQIKMWVVVVMAMLVSETSGCSKTQKCEGVECAEYSSYGDTAEPTTDTDQTAGSTGSLPPPTGCDVVPVAVYASAQVSCAAPSLTFTARDVEVFDGGTILFEDATTGEQIVVTGDCVAIAG